MARIPFARLRGLIILSLEVGGINENDSLFLPKIPLESRRDGISVGNKAPIKQSP